ncbi:unnamed protein product, partial [Tetraodon nigroviridis]
ALMNKENRFRDRAYSESGERALLQQKHGSQINSTRYKTELCRPFEENGSCKYGEKCQFAHGYHELRSLSRHPKYKTEPCRTFHTIGFCPYGPRCHFIHNADERRPAPPSNANVQAGDRDANSSYTQRDRPKLHHSLSFSGFSTHHGLESPLLDSPTSRTPPPPASGSCTSASSFYDDVLSPGSLSCINGAFSFPTQDLKALLAPLAVHTPGGYGNNHSTGAYYENLQGGGCPPSPPAYGSATCRRCAASTSRRCSSLPPARRTRSPTGRATPAGPSAPPGASAAPSPRAWTPEDGCQSSAGCRFLTIRAGFVRWSGGRRRRGGGGGGCRRRRGPGPPTPTQGPGLISTAPR